MIFRRIVTAALASTVVSTGAASSAAFTSARTTRASGSASARVAGSRATAAARSFTSATFLFGRPSSSSSGSFIFPSSLRFRGGGGGGPGSNNNNKSSTGLGMIFGNLFGGGAFNLKIDYTTLDHPGPELATSAQAGKVPTTSPKDRNLHLATFAGGCFWGLELAFQRVPGVVETAVGYSQGPEEFPTYEQVCAGATGHTEAVVVYYNPKECSYEQLLDTFFERVDPTTVNGQGRDYGKQYRTGVYYHTPQQEQIARKRFESEQISYKRPIATECKQAKPFWPAEKYHQQYLQKGGRFGQKQSAEKGSTDTIRCYG